MHGAGWAKSSSLTMRIAPRSGPQGDPDRHADDQDSRSRFVLEAESPADWSIRASCRSMVWASMPTAGRSTPCVSFAATVCKKPSPLPRGRRGRTRPRRAFLIAASVARPFCRRVRCHRLRPQPRRVSPRLEAGQHHAGQLRRNAGGRLGPGQAARPVGEPDRRHGANR